MAVSDPDYKLNHVFVVPAFDTSDKQHYFLGIIRTRYDHFVSFHLNRLFPE